MTAMLQIRAAVPKWRQLIALLRVHQWAKNGLIFVPALVGNRHDLETLTIGLRAFAVFCLVASSTYVLNDLLDMEADRQHPRKCQRPLASGAISPALGLSLIPLLLVAAGVLMVGLPHAFQAMVAVYVVTTCLYSLRLKKMLVIDVVVLGCLYALRVIAGGAAMGIVISDWLILFSIFLFLCIALVKRYTELAMLLQNGETRVERRSYRVEDLPVMSALTAAAGFNAVTVFGLYIGSDDVQLIYQRYNFLWLIVPMLIYWISRLIILAHRRKLHDDPLVFALRDPKSLLCGAATFLLLLWAV